MNQILVNAPNLWRLESPGADGWAWTARPNAARKYFMVSADCHANEPSDLWLKRMDQKYHGRLPRVVTDKDGVQWRVSEGHRPDRLRLSTLEGEDAARNKAGAEPDGRIADHDRDGIDVELMFPNKGLSMWATPDATFAMAQCRAWNDWAWETFSGHKDRIIVAGAIATGDLDGSIAEVQRLAKLGFRCLTLPCKPVWGAHDVNHPNYNLPQFDPLWAAIQDVDLPITFHISTGRDPRAARGNGGAVINYVSHSLSPTVEPVANLCASGVLERFKGLRFATIEAGIGWIPWLLYAMDEAYKKHHFWVRPKLQGLPSDYYRAHGFASFQEDQTGLDLMESHGLVENFMWANDYPHHEGTWPHSAEAIERTMGKLSDKARAQILGLNAARFLKLEVPARYRN